MIQEYKNTAQQQKYAGRRQTGAEGFSTQLLLFQLFGVCYFSVHKSFEIWVKLQISLFPTFNQPHVWPMKL